MTPVEPVNALSSSREEPVPDIVTPETHAFKVDWLDTLAATTYDEWQPALHSFSQWHRGWVLVDVQQHGDPCPLPSPCFFEDIRFEALGYALVLSVFACPPALDLGPHTYTIGNPASIRFGRMVAAAQRLIHVGTAPTGEATILLRLDTYQRDKYRRVRNL